MIHKLESRYTFDDTINKLENKLKDRGFIIFFRIDHKENANKVELDMNRCVVIYFGNPKAGTLLMKDNIEISYELPLRISIYEDNNKVYLLYKLPSEIGEEYNINNKILDNMDKAFLDIINF
ncbi:hypothetical protein MJ1_0396 [Nanobdella aerobiophila]|uniref:DUF302 domain-containing protein n=1 Tax=Nanobdella aerobiophila TaxID=2586965 RepID=A0A915SZZ2_9ARCH|nr:DUF302 domain-containing protein [Nanobdella aerobiophila]BBL45559.1 hypothetical protein MJ1_0396 [Nanobdella aerobiophila]